MAKSIKYVCCTTKLFVFMLLHLALDFAVFILQVLSGYLSL